MNKMLHVLLHCPGFRIHPTAELLHPTLHQPETCYAAKYSQHPKHIKRSTHQQTIYLQTWNNRSDEHKLVFFFLRSRSRHSSRFTSATGFDLSGNGLPDAIIGQYVHRFGSEDNDRASTHEIKKKKPAHHISHPFCWMSKQALY